ncbi:MAG TPA: sortase [Patescibacteria group bacterium]|nr:sortase [Patescibacteria group bacterium]
MTRREIIRFLIIRTIGNFLLLFAVFGVIATFGPALYYEFQYRAIQARGVHFTVAESVQSTETVLPNPTATPPPSNRGFGDVLSGPTEQILVPPDPSFSILIPKIGASAKVFPNVDPTLESEYLPTLLRGVAHAKGTVFPGVAGNTYLFAHSTDNFWDVGRYNAVFYLLKDLSVGDEIVVFFENRRFDYKVTGTQILEPSEVSYLLQGQTGKQKLILQTCWPPGTSWKRLVVFAEPK